MDRMGQEDLRTGEQGYAMAVLLVAIAILMTFMSVAMPVWNQDAKREKEEELLFRLKQYAHAIALYQRQFPGAQPPTIELLVEQRFLRRKYKDPMTGKEFAVLRLGQASPGMTTPLPGMLVPQGGASGLPMQPPGQGFGQGQGQGSGQGQRQATRDGPGLGPGRGSELAGPIRGVVSTSKETSLRVWKGRTRYDEWEVAPEDIVPRFFGTNPLQDGVQPGGAGSPRVGSPGPGGGVGPGGQGRR
jgi:type II secretory pathway pseudopilin PulG